MVATRTITIEDFERMGSDADDFELVDGVLRERGIMGGLHGEVGGEAYGRLYLYLAQHQIGRLYLSDTGFIIDRERGSILRPDIAFVRNERLPPRDNRIGYMPIAPDLVVEVISPNDRFVEVAEKVARYQRAGVPLIWIVQPSPPAVIVYAAGQEPHTIGDDGVLDGGEILPGFRLPVQDIFR